MATQAQKDGKAWEDELKNACKTLLGWSYNFNNIGQQSYQKKPKGRYMSASSAPAPRPKAKRPADRVTLLPPIGRLVLIEAKATRKNKLERRAIATHQEKNLWRVAKCGGLAVVAIRWWSPKSKRWTVNALCHYADLMAHLRAIGRKSLPLKDGDLPDFLIQMEKKSYPVGSRFDIKEALEQLAEREPAELFWQSPEVELM